MIKSEIYITKYNHGYYRIDIYSHVKNLWVYHGEHLFGDVLFLFEDLGVTKDNTIIRMKFNNLLYYKLKIMGFTINYHGQ